MNILLTKFPKSIDFDENSYAVVTDFRKWIEFELCLFENIPNEKKLEYLLEMMIDKPLIDSEEKLLRLIDRLLLFYNCAEQSNTNNSQQQSKRIYSYDKDQYYIYVDFMRYYDIDLNTCEMHWWKFRQLLLELPEDSKTKTIMMYRSISVNSKMSKEQRQFYYKMKKLYSLEDKTIKNHGQTLASHMKINS